MLMVVAWWSRRSRIALAMTVSPVLRVFTGDVHRVPAAAIAGDRAELGREERRASRRSDLSRRRRLAACSHGTRVTT
jgi:hypothetical protein